MNKNEVATITENEIMEMMNETSCLVANHNINQLSSAAVAAQSSNALVNNVEFWQWMSRNYSGSGIFDSSATMQQYIAQGTGKEAWMGKQLQGKGYEWDWMTAQRNNPQNILNRYDAGDVVNRMASDVTETNLLTGKNAEYQMKAYTGKTNPHLDNTTNDITVITNAEKGDIVRNKGYNVEEFQNNNAIAKNKEQRLEQIKDGRAYTNYNFKNVAGTMAKAGVIGCVVGMGTEAIFSYKAWKNGQLTDEQYLKEILKSGGDAGVTAGATAGVMIPVSAAITAAGLSTIITIPVAFVIGGVVNKIVAPCFGRGEYRNILSKAQYYQNLENVYDDLVKSMEIAGNQYYNFVKGMSQQQAIHQSLKQKSKEIDNDLMNLYNLI